MLIAHSRLTPLRSPDPTTDREPALLSELRAGRHLDGGGSDHARSKSALLRLGSFGSRFSYENVFDARRADAGRRSLLPARARMQGVLRRVQVCDTSWLRGDSSQTPRIRPSQRLRPRA